MSSVAPAPVAFPLVEPLGVELGTVEVTWGHEGSHGIEIICEARLDDAGDAAIQDAIFAAWRHGAALTDGAPRRAQVRLTLTEAVDRVEGSSLGLAVALAARACHPDDALSVRWRPHAVVATGRVERDGAVSPVDQLVEKAQALPLHTLVAVFSAPARGRGHPALHDARVVEVRTLDEAWSLVCGEAALRALQKRLWRRLDHKLPRAVPVERAWLRAPAELEDWEPDALGPDEPRVTLLRGASGTGRSAALRQWADKIHGEVDFGGIRDDLLLWASERDPSLEAALKGNPPPADAEPGPALLDCAPYCIAGRVWVLADLSRLHPYEALERIEAWLAADPRIQVIAVADESLDDERLEEAGLRTRRVDLLPLWCDATRLTEAGQRGLGHLSPLTTARVLRDPLLLAAAQDRARRRATLVREWTAAPLMRLWLQDVQAQALRAWAGRSPLAGTLTRLYAHRLLFPASSPRSDSADLTVPIEEMDFEDLVVLSAPMDAEATPDASGPDRGAETERAHDIWGEWWDEDTRSLTPPRPFQSRLLAHAFHTSPIWRGMGVLPDPQAWLRARDPVLRPVLVEVLAQQLVEVGLELRGGANPGEAEGFCDHVVGGVVAEAAPADLRLLAGLLLRAAWVAADWVPEVVPVATDSIGRALHAHGPRRGLEALFGGACDALFSPQSLDLLLACPDASLGLLDALDQASRRLWSDRVVGQRMRPLQALRALLHGDPAPAAARLAAHRPAPSDHQDLGPDALDRFDAYPPSGSADAYLHLLWTDTVLPPPPSAPALTRAVEALADTHWAAVEAWLDWPGLDQFGAEALDEFLNNQWLSLAAPRQPWTRRGRGRLLPKLRARAAALGVTLDRSFAQDQPQRGAELEQELRQRIWDLGTGATRR